MKVPPPPSAFAKEFDHRSFLYAARLFYSNNL